ncbi:MAG TPA: MFS transporter [Microscillaceae bacterium]|nr:MFS transporter [Microscillaceae bacterium]
MNTHQKNIASNKTIQKNRIAVAAFFFVNGLLYANWTARLPELQRFLGLNNTLLGALLLVSALGAVISMPFAGWLTTRFGSDKTTPIAGLLFVCMVPLLVIYPNWQVASIFFFLIGMSAGTLDVSMNNQAVFVERAYQKPIMSSFHAVFSIGMALGAGVGALFAKYQWTLFHHLALLALFGLLVLGVASFFMVKQETSSRPSSEEQLTGESKDSKRSKSFLKLPAKAVLPLGLIAFCGMTGEGAMADWSAIFMSKVVGNTDFFSALAFGIFGVAMTIGRLVGDYATEKLGKFRLMTYNSLLAFVGLLLPLLFPVTWVTLLGFFLIGLGLATVVPIVYSTAGNTPGVSPGEGIAMATTIGYAGFFVGPPVIGFLADEIGLRAGLLFALVLFGVMGVLVRRMKVQ